jgi:hypothetical protein
MITVRGFVSHAFNDAVYEGGRDAFRKSIDQLVASACADFASEGVVVEHKLFFEATEYGRPLMPGMREQIRASDFLIADITQPDPAAPVNPNVMYEIGFAMALNKRIIVMRRNPEPAPPSDIGDLLAGTYEHLTKIPIVFAAEMINVVTDTLAKASRDTTRVEPFISKVWFPTDTRSISIVCSREPEPSKFSDRHEANYVHIDNFEDRDALIELATFFARRYPDANVVYYLCDEMPHAAKNGDLVILGGPGCVTGEGNAVGLDLMQMLESKVTYPANGDGLIWNNGALRRTTYEEDDDTKGVTSDWGSILAAPNPYNPTARVIMLHGTTTYGTLGAAIALIDSPTAMKNHLRLARQGCEDRLTGALNFEALVRAEVDSNTRVKPPTLDFESIRRIAA